MSLRTRQMPSPPPSAIPLFSQGLANRVSGNKEISQITWETSERNEALNRARVTGGAVSMTRLVTEGSGEAESEGRSWGAQAEVEAARSWRQERSGCSRS